MLSNNDRFKNCQFIFAIIGKAKQVFFFNYEKGLSVISGLL